MRIREAIVWLLLERVSIDINAKDKEGKTSLTWATERKLSQL